MKVDVEPLEGCKRRIAVEAPVEVVNRAWERAYGQVQKQARLPGFRKGHLPRALVKLHFADDVRREVAERLIPDVYREAVTEARVSPVDEPDLQDVRLEEGAPLSFVAVVEVRPAVTLEDGGPIEVVHSTRAVTEAEVDEALEHMREHHAELRGVERPAAAGDQVTIDYTMTLEGETASSDQGQVFTVGEKTVLPEIDEAVVGVSAGESREVPVRFADDHRRETLRGKSGRVQVTVTEVKEKVLPPVDDELARTLGEFDSLEALRAELRRQLEARRAVEERRQLEERLVDALLARHPFPVPEALVMRQVAQQVEYARERMRQGGLDPDRVPWDYQKLLGELRPSAERAVRRALLLDAIAEREGFAATPGEVDAEVERIAEASQRPAPAIRRMMEKSGDLDGLRLRLRDGKTFDLLVSRAQIREEPA